MVWVVWVPAWGAATCFLQVFSVARIHRAKQCLKYISIPWFVLLRRLLLYIMKSEPFFLGRLPFPTSQLCCTADLQYAHTAILCQLFHL